MNYPTLITENNVILMKGGKRFIANKTHPNFNKIIDRLRRAQYVNIERLFNFKEQIEKCFNVSVRNGNQVFYKDKQLHSVLANKILTFVREGLPYRPLMKFTNLLMENPSETARETLFDYLDLHKLPICEDGHFIAAKAVRKDFKDHWSGTISNKVGERVYMDRNKVSKDPNECAGPGLHCGSSQYVRNYKNGESRYVLLKCNPKNVVVVPREGSFGKIRLCEYKVISEIQLEDLDFSSDYAPNNKQYKEIREKAKVGPKRDSMGRFVSDGRIKTDRNTNKFFLTK